MLAASTSTLSVIIMVALPVIGAIAVLLLKDLNKATINGLKDNVALLKDRSAIQELQIKELEKSNKHCMEQHASDSEQIKMLKELVTGRSALDQLGQILGAHNEQMLKRLDEIKELINGR